MSVKKANSACWPTVSVVIAAFSMKRWDDLCSAVASVQAQAVSVLETIVVIDHHPDLFAQATRALPSTIVLENMGSRGASGARNTGVSASRGEVVVFLDDDAVASPIWLEALLTHFGNRNVVGVGGRLDPLWATARPRWFPREFDWVVGASYLGMPNRAEPVRNVWSNNMAIRRRVFDMVGGFRDDFGKVGMRSRPEDTDLCLRAAAKHADGVWVYEPMGAAGHRVPMERASLRYFAYRCFMEGWGKAELAELNGVGASTSSERRYTGRILPAGFARGVREACQGDVSGAWRSLTIATGFAVVVIGYLVGSMALVARGRYFRRLFAGW